MFLSSDEPDRLCLNSISEIKLANILKKKSKKTSSKFLRLDYTTALVVGAACLFIFSVGLITSSKVQSRVVIENDHKRPLEITNLPYCNGEKLDLFVPSVTKPVPLVIYIHGGGWQYGSKVGDSLDYVKPMVKQNYAVASLNYRLSGSAKFPAQIQDVYCAVRFLRERAPQYSIDGSKIGLVGVSAGAHLAVLAANASDQAEFTKGDYPEISSSVQSVVSINGLLDLDAKDLLRASTTNMGLLLNGTSYSPFTASPRTYLTKSAPAQFIIYSANDNKVPSSQSLDYYTAATEMGVKTRLLKVDSADHTLNPYRSLSIKPSKQQIMQQIEAFFDDTLR